MRLAILLLGGPHDGTVLDVDPGETGVDEVVLNVASQGSSAVYRDAYEEWLEPSAAGLFDRDDAEWSIVRFRFVGASELSHKLAEARKTIRRMQG